jgi:hypothetical protein
LVALDRAARPNATLRKAPLLLRRWLRPGKRYVDDVLEREGATVASRSIQRLPAVLPRGDRKGLLFRMRSKSKTSVEILEERDALHARVVELERSLTKVQAEIEQALRHPEIHFLTLCRIEAVVRAQLRRRIETSDDLLPGPPISKTHPSMESAEERRHAGW